MQYSFLNKIVFPFHPESGQDLSGRYVAEKAPVIIQYLTKLCGIHGPIHPELHEIHTIFSKSYL